MKKDKMECTTCGSKLTQITGELRGVFICYDCKKIDRIVNAIKELTSKVDIIISRSQRGNL